MPKRELHRFHVQASPKARKRRGRKLVIRLRDTKTSSVETNGDSRQRREEWLLEQGRKSLSEMSGKKALPALPAANSPNSSALVPINKHRLQRSFWRWTLLWVSVFSIMGIAVTSGVLLLTKLPPPIDCRKISPLSTDGDRLYCARAKAESGKLDQLVEAIRLVQYWPQEHPLHKEAQRQMTEWSKAILNLAQQKLQEESPSGAITIASKIPFNSPVYPEAQAKIATWKQQIRRAGELASQIQDALKVQKWQKASQLVTELSRLTQDSWNSSRVDALMRQLITEKEAWQKLEEARELAKTNTVEQLKEAIAITTKIAAKSYVKAQAMAEQSRWSRTLVEMAAKLFEQKDFADAIKALDQIPVTTPQYAEAQDWIRLSRASETVKKDNILTFVDALAAVQPIAPSSPVHKLASSQAALWQQELQDLTQMQLARLFASFQQRTGLAYAIDKANRIAPGRPQRLAAQTLIAQWRKEIQQIDDRNTLESAKQLAEGGTMAEQKAAVELASQIKLGQPLRIDAQTEIAKWNRQIQALEDQPILDLAEALAQRRDLVAAISTAGQIRPERPLYPEAQKAIAEWVAQVQTAQDRPILDAAAALAAQGRFDAAIATAYQIPPDRALYEQAQAAIANWTEQKTASADEARGMPLDTE